MPRSNPRVDGIQACELSPHEQKVLATATHYIASAFWGVGRYDKLERPTRAQAQAAARSMPTQHGRPVMVYAVNAAGSQAAIDLVWPVRQERKMA